MAPLYAPRTFPFEAIRCDVVGCLKAACFLANARPDVIRRHLIVDHGAEPIDVFAAAFRAIVDAWERELMVAIDDDEPAQVTENTEESRTPDRVSWFMHGRGGL